MRTGLWLQLDEFRRSFEPIAEAAGGVGARTQLAPEFARSPHPNKKNPAGLGGKFCWAVRWSGF